MKVIGVVGSHNPEGNTAQLVNKVLEGAENNRAETKIFILGNMNIKPCIACDRCRGGNSCKQQDDMQEVYQALDEADHIVLGSPVYFDHITAKTKAFIDRLYPYYQNKKLESAQTIIQTYSWDKPDQYAEPLEYLKTIMQHYFNIETKETLNIHDTMDNPVSTQPELLDRALKIGERIAS